MNALTEKFIQSNSNRAITGVMKKLDNINCDERFFKEVKDQTAVENLIIKLKPNSLRSITTITYILGLYVNFLEAEKILDDDTVYQIIRGIDRKVLWVTIKPEAKKKFISHEDYIDLIYLIETTEERNAKYYTSLFRCLYEGIYCDDMSVVANLRGGDIHKDIVTVRNDNGEVYEIQLPHDLIVDLLELAETDVWERLNKYGEFQQKVNGRYPDSCFKIENRKEYSASTYRFGYYNKLRKISKDYIKDYELKPLQIFVSGIMYRIRLQMEKEEIDFEDAFSNQNRDRNVSRIINNELERCHYDIKPNSFREIVEGHIDVFMQ